MKFLRNNWVITLTATLVGVFAALYLNELDATKKIKNQKAIAKENILAEIQSNGEKMKVAVQKHIEFREIIMFMNSYSDEETDDLIVPLDSMNHFRKNHPNTILVRDSIELNKGIYKYEDGQINFDFSTPQYELTTIAWKTLKNSGITSSFDFECLMFLEGLYNITEKVLEKNEKLLDEVLLDMFINENKSKTMNRKLISHLKFLIDYEESLVKMFENSDEQLNACD